MKTRDNDDKLICQDILKVILAQTQAIQLYGLCSAKGINIYIHLLITTLVNVCNQDDILINFFKKLSDK